MRQAIKQQGHSEDGVGNPLYHRRKILYHKTQLKFKTTANETNKVPKFTAKTNGI
jgi:hypothetical protein